jgi:hypothetical protein
MISDACSEVDHTLSRRLVIGDNEGADTGVSMIIRVGVSGFSWIGRGLFRAERGKR